MPSECLRIIQSLDQDIAGVKVQHNVGRKVKCVMSFHRTKQRTLCGLRRKTGREERMAVSCCLKENINIHEMFAMCHVGCICC